jgi:hypothetical protein
MEALFSFFDYDVPVIRLKDSTSDLMIRVLSRDI